MQAWIRLIRAHDVTQRDLGLELHTEHGLTRKDYEALFLLALSEGGRMKRVDLAQRLSLTPGGVTRLLEGLEQEGLVERIACDTDLRVSYAALTDAGREKYDAASCGHMGSVRSVMEENLTPEEIETLAELLGKLPGVGNGTEACPGV
jgi:DNA-binding MarR family transcriptional regulator